MALPDIRFNPVYDIHLLRGMSANLIDMLRVGDDTAIVFRNNNPLVSYAFTPFFKKTSGAGTQHTGSNITVDTSTGAITTLAAAPVPEKRNFLIKAEAKLAGEKRETLIRIHIHQSIAEAWLSPSLLTVQKITGNFCKFSVRVRFNDNVVADISEGSSFNVFPNNFYAISWSHPTPGLVNAATGTIDPNIAPTTGQLPNPVTANITPSGGAAVNATGSLFIADQLAGTNPNVKAQLVTSGRCPGFIKANEVPNVLFIPDGFRSEDKDIFDRIIDNYVSDLSKGKITAPFDMLAGSMNFWKVFVTSGDRGVTSKCDVYVKEVDGKLKGVPLPNPVKPVLENGNPNDNSAEWYYYHLLYHVGLPLRDDVSALVRTNAVLKAEWKLTTLLTVPQVNDITDDAIENWRRVGERRLPEERDTVLGLLVNDYSAVSVDNDFNEIDFSSKRMTRSGLNSFLSTLKDADGNPIGKYFISGGANELQGKDFKNIVLVSAATRAREQNLGMGFFITIKEFEGSFEMEGNDITLKKMVISFNNEMEEFSTDKKATLTHELGHSFALEDEYGEQPPASSFEGKFINDSLVSGWNYTRYTGSAANLDWSSNVVARTDLLSLNTNSPGTNMLDANKLKWRYHRIDKCAVVTSGITATANANEYKISVRPGHTQGFATTQKAFLRKRVVFSYRVSRTVGVAVPPQNVLNINPATIHLTAATITNVNAGTNQITVSDADGASYVITFASPGSAALFSNGDVVEIQRWMQNEPIYSITRTSPPAPNTPVVSDTIIPSISQELEVVSVNNTTNEVVFKTTDNNALNAVFLTSAMGNEIVFYKPMDAPSSVRTSAYKYAEVISKKVLDYLVSNPFPFNAKPDAAHGNTITEVIDRNPEQDTSIPSSLVPSCTSQEQKIVAVYSCGDQHHGDVYHPTGKCFMRNEYHNGSLEEFCMVCKYTLVNMIDPRKHDELNGKYSSKIYPT
jgi:hypothetical protein